MKAVSIRRQLIVWGLGALGLSAPALMLAAYLLTLGEIDEVLDDSLRQTALLLADRDLAGALPTQPAAPHVDEGDTESGLVAIARRPDGSLLFSSQPERTPVFPNVAGLSRQQAFGEKWNVYTVIQKDRAIQVAQPVSVRREVAAESASQLLVPLAGLLALIAGLLVIALRRGLRPLEVVNEALAVRHADSLAPLDADGVPAELHALVNALNGLLDRLSAAFEAQRHFVADAAHELRSPVTALQLQLQLLQESVDPQERAACVAELAAGISRTRRLIEQLLTLSRATSDATHLQTPPPLVDVGALVRDAVGRWSVEAEARQIDLGAQTPSNPVLVRAEPAQLEILLNNLVDNALRYTPRGGVIDVCFEMFEGLPTIRVIDTGLGIAPDERNRVFDRFYRSPEAISTGEAGSGLGLAIVRAIAERHAARVSLHAAPGGRGLEVRVSFPAQA